MTKFDDMEHLPAVFRNNGLAVLPTARGDYVISDVAAYKRLESENNNPVIYRRFPDYIQSLDYEAITSESIAINCAYVSGILGDFLGELTLNLTVSGRMSSGQFQYHIDRTQSDRNPLSVHVKNAQIEIDGGYEGPESLALIEAKNSVPYTFLVRQLYYPFRLWSSRVEKPVRSIFLTYTNRIFHFYEYTFSAPEHYNSLSLIREQRYSLEPIDITLNDIGALLESTEIVEEPEEPFPQADSFERIINLCELLHDAPGGTLSHEEITIAFNFVGRQTHYYTAAGLYLDLIDKDHIGTVTYMLSKRGRELFKKNHRERQLGFAAAMLAHVVFAKGMAHYLQTLAVPSAEEIVILMKRAGLRNINKESTYRRRARTVRSWLGWIIGLQPQAS